MSTKGLSLQEQRWNNWSKLASQRNPNDSSAALYPAFSVKALNASYSHNVGCLAVMAFCLGALAMMPILILSINDAGIDVDCLTFQLGSGITASIAALIIYCGYRFAAKHRREIEEDQDEESDGLYQRTLAKDREYQQRLHQRYIRGNKHIVEAYGGNEMRDQANKGKT